MRILFGVVLFAIAQVLLGFNQTQEFLENLLSPTMCGSLWSLDQSFLCCFHSNNLSL